MRAIHCHSAFRSALKPLTISQTSPSAVDTLAIMQSGARDNAVSSISMRSLPPTTAAAAAAATTASSKPAVYAKMTHSSSQTLCDVPTTFSAPVKKGTVRFNSSIRIRPIPSLSFMSDEEKREIWYYVSTPQLARWLGRPKPCRL